MVIAHNTFLKNAGYLDSSVVYIRARGRNGASIFTTTPNDAGIFCVGYHFESNVFTENFGCPRYSGAVIKMECVEYGDTSAAMNDRITHSTLSSGMETNYYSMPFAYTAVALSASYTYGGTTKTITGDMKKTTLVSNSYTRNSATGGSGIVDFQGVPRVLIESETFTNNGDSASNVITAYGSGVLASATIEMSIDGS